VVALDLGERRIGVAVTDSRRTVALPRGVIERSGNADRDTAAIVSVLEEVNATLVVVGLPRSLSGAEGPAATRARADAARIERAVDLPVTFVDERLSTVEAARRERGARRGSGRSPAPRRRPVLDDLAAVVVLEQWLAGAVGKALG
jgi:putative Holliday junction resolvase